MSNPENIGAIDVVAQAAAHQPMPWRYRAGFGLAGAALSTAAGVLAPSPVFADSDAIYAGPDDVSTYVNTPTDPIDVLANDTDSTGSQLSVLGVDPNYGPNAGTVTFNRANSTFIYTPNSGYTGEDTFLYMDKDAAGNEQDGVVTVDVQQAAGPDVSVSTHCANPHQQDGDLNVSVTNTSNSGSATYKVFPRAQSQTAETPSPEVSQAMTVQAGETATANFSVTDGEYEVQVGSSADNYASQAAPVKYVTEALCKVIDVKAKVSKHLFDGRYAQVAVNNYNSGRKVKITIVDAGARSHHTIAAEDRNEVYMQKTPKGTHAVKVYAGSKLIARRTLHR